MRPEEARNGLIKFRLPPSLEYLKLGSILYGKEPLASKFPSISLPNLQVLECDRAFLGEFEDVSSLEHLFLSLGGSTPPFVYHSQHSVLQKEYRFMGSMCSFLRRR